MMPLRDSRNGLWSVLIVASLTAMFYPAMAQHVRNSADPLRLNDDARQQIWPFLRFYDPALLRSDYLTDYQLAINPIGWDALYRVGARFVDPRQLSKAMPYLALATMLAAVGVAAWRLGGPAAAWGSLALSLGADLYLDEMGGGLPRGFGYPVVAAVAAALVTGSPYRVAVVTCVGASLYFPMGVVGGITLVLLLLLPQTLGGVPKTWTLRRRAAIVAVTGVLAMAIVLPNVLTAGVYGRLLGPSDWSRFPEAGIDGRLGDEDVVARPPLASGLRALPNWASTALSGGGDTPWIRAYWELGQRYRSPLLASVAIIVLVGYGGLTTCDPAARRLLLLPLTGLVAYLLSWLVIPYLYVPERYLKFCIPIAVVLMVPAGVHWLFRHGRSATSSARAAGPLTIACCLALVGLLGGRGSSAAGLSLRIPENEIELHHYLSSLSPDVLLAGWPTVMDNVPYMTGRRVFVTLETHLPFHEEYVLEMRRRMTALIDAYFAGEPGPLLVLRDRFGVTHLIVDRRHYTGQTPTYFKPFDVQVARTLQGMTRQPEVLRQADVAGVFQAGDIIVLDLAKVMPHP
jgi:hypothetical protein